MTISLKNLFLAKPPTSITHQKRSQRSQNHTSNLFLSNLYLNKNMIILITISLRKGSDEVKLFDADRHNIRDTNRRLSVVLSLKYGKR